MVVMKTSMPLSKSEADGEVTSKGTMMAPAAPRALLASLSLDSYVYVSIKVPVIRETTIRTGRVSTVTVMSGWLAFRASKLSMIGRPIFPAPQMANDLYPDMLEEWVGEMGKVCK
jgi:hypothetical protein